MGGLSKGVFELLADGRAGPGSAPFHPPRGQRGARCCCGAANRACAAIAIEAGLAASQAAAGQPKASARRPQGLNRSEGPPDRPHCTRSRLAGAL